MRPKPTSKQCKVCSRRKLAADFKPNRCVCLDCWPHYQSAHTVQTPEEIRARKEAYRAKLPPLRRRTAGKMSDRQVREAIRLLEHGWSKSALGRRYGVDPKTIRNKTA